MNVKGNNKAVGTQNSTIAGGKQWRHYQIQTRDPGQTITPVTLSLATCYMTLCKFWCFFPKREATVIAKQ